MRNTARPRQVTNRPHGGVGAFPLLVFAWVAYAVFARSMLYFIGFVGNVYVPRPIDGPPVHSAFASMVINAALVLAFAVHHSALARPGSKRWVRAALPSVLERSAYVLVSSLLLILLMWKWSPLAGWIWFVESPPWRAVMWAVFTGGWVLALLSSFRLGHGETFGLRPALRRVQRRPHAPRGLEQRAMYAVVRHPMYVGFLLGIWATPQMSLGHFQLAGMLTIYVAAARFWEERDLVTGHGEGYAAYRRRVPAFVPRLRRSAPAESPSGSGR